MLGPRLHCFRVGLLQQGWQVYAGSAELQSEVPSPGGLPRTGRLQPVSRRRRHLREVRLRQQQRAVPTNVHAISRRDLQGVVRLSGALPQTVRQVCRWELRDSGVS